MKFIDAVSNFFKFESKCTARPDHNTFVDPIGVPRFIVRDREGNIVDDFEGHNLVVNAGRNALLRFLMGDYTQALQKIELGSGGATVGDPFTPLPVAPTDLTLVTPFAPVVVKNITGKAYDAGTYPTKGEFSVIFDSSEVNQIVSEAALKFVDNRMYARYTFPSVYLKADKGYSLEIIWSTNFS